MQWLKLTSTQKGASIYVNLDRVAEIQPSETGSILIYSSPSGTGSMISYVREGPDQIIALSQGQSG